ncbi:MAG: hypothetical protein NC453_12225 [Muribaculum sp.]|nr:hypothetical protein [Muribaculum sp.]
MPVFEVYVDQNMGVSHCGDISEGGCSEVELTDAEVETLVDLIRKNGTSDVEELKLSEHHPKIFSKLNDACRAAACKAEESYWLEVGFSNPECHDFDAQDMIDYLKARNAFNFEYDEADFLDEDGNLDEEALEEAELDFLNESALEDYVFSLPEKERKEFLRHQVGIDVDLSDIEYAVVIPQEIIDMA